MKSNIVFYLIILFSMFSIIIYYNTQRAEDCKNKGGTLVKTERHSYCIKKGIVIE